MKLGDQFLEGRRGARRVPSRTVQFPARATDSQSGEEYEITAMAQLVIVPETRRLELEERGRLWAAEMSTRASGGDIKAQALSAGSYAGTTMQRDCEIYCLLAEALRSPKSTSIFLVGSPQELVAALPSVTVTQGLWAEYCDLRDREYPSAVTAEALAKLKEEAKKNSSSGQPSPGA
jgi:hypothetical protein